MKTLFLNCKIFLHIWQYFTSVVGRLLCFIKKRKLSTTTNDHQHTIPPPMSIQIQGEHKCEEIKLIDWNTWGDETSPPPQEDNLTEIEIPAEELFKDMTPVINKAKVVHVTKKVKVAARSPTTMNSPFAFQSKHSNINDNNSSRINFNAQYQVESELGVWNDDEPSGWDDQIDDTEISQQTDNLIKETRQQQREQRAEEQKRKRIEKELQRAQRRTDSIGIKIS